VKDFFVTAKFQMKLPNGVTGVDGGIIMPSKVAHPTVERRDLARTYPHLATRFIDPQVYLSTLNVGSARSTCANLYSYAWFPGPAMGAFDSSQQSQRDWKRDATQEILQLWQGRPPTSDTEIEDCIRRCVDVQLRVGCAGIILPCPLTSEPHSRFEMETHWAETGLAIAQRMAPDHSRYVSVALSDRCLRGVDPWRSVLLDEVLDQLTAREPEGIYLLVELANEDAYYIGDPNTIGSILRLCDGFKRGGIDDVIVAYAGTAGLLALAAGADAWTSGWYRGERRMRMSDFYSEEGRSYPAYYSHPLAAEFHMEQDLDNAVAAGFLPRIADATPASAGLLQALQQGRGTAAAAEWTYRVQNLEASKQHFFTACVRETAALAALDEQKRIDATLGWLEDATKLANDLFKAVGRFNARTSLSHQHSWWTAFRTYVASR
jgi:hypothetical protein